jgi:eukaryotic-like serine/threonine-protein kinase
MPELRSSLSSGDVVAGNYQVLSTAGTGGMGVVYRALDLKLGRTVALKFLPAELNTGTTDKQRFLKEARIASSLDHANLGAIYGVEETSDGRTFIVMAFYEGLSLANRIGSRAMPVPEAIEIAIQMARGLAEAHAHDVVHRDIKPSNVMITKQGVAKIVDFGLARVSTGETTSSLQQGVAGTVGYMSPEQAMGKSVDQRTDIWALGVVLDEMLTGQNPFLREGSPGKTVFAVLNEPPRPMEGAPLELQQIVYKALAKDPLKRYQTCSEMLKDLEQARAIVAGAEGPLVAPGSRPSVRSNAFRKALELASESGWIIPRPPKRRWIAWLAVPLILLLVAATGLLIPAVRERIRGMLFSSQEKHIAVLPFENIGNDSKNEALVEGLMDSLSGRLSNLEVGNQSLWVVPASEVRHRKVTEPSEAFKQLGATLAVQGSVERDGQDVHLNVDLINAKSLRLIGSLQLDDRAGDMAALQAQAVAGLARLMNITVTADELRVTGGSANPAAYEDYLRALGYMQRFDKPGNLDLAVSALQESVKTDPSFALGYAQMGEAYRRKYTLDKNPKWIDEVLANCNRAAQLDDRLPATFVTLGATHSMLGKNDLALQEFQQALRLDPHSTEALRGIAAAYNHMGRTQDAEAAYQRAIALQPDYWNGYNMLGLFYDGHDRYQDAIAQLQHALQLTPDNAAVYSNLAAVYLDMGDPKVWPQAEQALRKSIQLNPTYESYANLGSMYLSEGRYAESATMTEKALEFNDKDFQVWANLMEAYRWLHNAPKAEAAAERTRLLLEQTAKVKPQDPQIQSELAILYAEEKMRDKALLHIDKALALAPTDSRVLADAAETYEDMGDRNKAIQYAEKGLKSGLTLDDLKARAELQSLLADPSFRENGK